MTFTYTNSAADLIALNQFILETGGVQRPRLQVRVFLAILISSAFAFLAQGQWPLVAIGLLMGTLVYLAFPRAWARVATQESLKQPMAQSFLCSHTLTLSPDDLTEETPHSRSTCAWSSFHSFVVLPSHIFIFLAPGLAHVVPTAQLSETVRASLVSLLEQHLRRHSA